MQKKSLALLLSAAMVIASLAGCGSSSGNSAGTEAAPAEPAQEAEAPAEEAPAKEEASEDGVVITFGA